MSRTSSKPKCQVMMRTRTSQKCQMQKLPQAKWRSRPHWSVFATQTQRIINLKENNLKITSKDASVH